MPTVLEVKHLVKTFGSITAVNDISFSIEQGTCFGLLGPNGAGKTTTVEILEGISKPTSGTVLYQGEALDARFSHDAGIMFQHTALQDYMTVREALEMFGQFYHRTVAIDTLIEQCALGEFLDQDTRKLSGGQKQRLLLAIAMVNDPQVLFLDEPTTGLDPQARRNFWQLLNDIKGAGKTIVLTTHYMEEASLLCDELVFIDHGQVIASGSPAILLEAQFDDVVLELPLAAFVGAAFGKSGFTEPGYADPVGSTTLLPPSPAIQSVHRDRDRVEILTGDVNSCVELLLQQEISLGKLQIRSRNLEDLFLALTGKELRA